MMKTGNIFSKNARLLWGLLLGGYMVFIFSLSYWYPYGLDELNYTPSGPAELWQYFVFVYYNVTGRIGFLVNLFILYFGRWSFLLLNPLLQLLSSWLAFYFIFMRRPDTKTLADWPSFLLLLILSVFTVAQPDNTLIWTGGAASYSWSFIPFLLALILLRKLARGEAVFKDGIFVFAAAFIFGFVCGMTNENSGPMLLILFLGGIFYFMRIKAVIPSYYIFIAGGIICGLLFLFCAPANIVKSGDLSYKFFAQSTFSQKLFWHFAEANDYLRITLCLPLVMVFGFSLSVWQKGFGELKKPSVRLFLFCFAVSLMLFGALAFAPAPERSLYSATAVNNISFVLLLSYLKETYGKPFIRWAALVAFSGAAAFALPFMYPYYNLHCQSLSRRAILQEAKRSGAAEVFLPAYRPLKNIAENYNLAFYDPVKETNPACREKMFGVKAQIKTDAVFNIGNMTPAF